MVQLIAGQKGKGKTIYLLDKVNNEVKNVSGNIVFLDKSTKHMFELNNKVRLIDVSDYSFVNSAEFVGFVCGIISQDHDLEQIYFDSFLKIAKLEDSDPTEVITRLDKISEKFGVELIISISLDAEELDESIKSKVVTAL